jgi:hypothetical protein
MIISSEFPGDNNDDLKWVQHDEYMKDCGVAYLLRCAQERYGDAIRLLGVETDLWQQMRRHDELYYPWSEKVPQQLPIQMFDHRVLQAAHDEVAAVFRFRNPALCTPLFPLSEAGLKELTTLWLQFWTAEVNRLVKNNRVTLAVLQAVAYQNEELGYAAERELLKLLQAEYVDLPRKTISGE